MILRGIFIAVGAAAIAQFSWVFYLFGLFLLYTAIQLVREGTGGHDENEEYEPNAIVRWIQKRLPATDEFDSDRLLTIKNGKRLVTPLFMVVVALGMTDVLFALDSIPAIYGLTKEPYIVFTTNAFALLGLLQLYFLLGGLLTRLVYLSLGLSFILAFIGVKLIIEAMHTTSEIWNGWGWRDKQIADEGDCWHSKLIRRLKIPTYYQTSVQGGSSTS
mgnify:CR=1 FL=1